MMCKRPSQPKASKSVSKADTKIIIQLNPPALKSRFFGENMAARALAIKPTEAWFPKLETPVVKKPFKLSDLVKKN